MDSLTEEQKALLTEEELEGLMEDEDGDGDDSDDDAEGDDEDVSATGQNDTEAQGEQTDEGDDEQPDAADDSHADASAQTQAEDQTTDAQPVSAANTSERPPNWILPDDHKQQKDTIEQQRDELARKFDDGDLTAEEYRSEAKSLDQRFEVLREQELLAKVREQTAKDGWRDTVDGFLTEKPQYRDPALQALLDQEVRELQAKAVNPLKRSILEEADQRLTARLSAALGVKTETPPAAAAKNPPKKIVRDDPPPSLRNVPAADVDDAADGGEFAYLDRLQNSDSVKYEAELAKLSPEMLDRYMQS
jgi:hypothetical protein